MREQMNIVIVGHVDHGKSTVIGRLLADTDSLPEGKLEQVKSTCERNSKPFEYAFLLDALKDEQDQGITIDSARCFFNSDKRNYIIIDAPGHIEFLKNMVTGASRAEAALLVIDANEGIKENSKRHGHMVAMLGVKQVSVVVNKMDLVDYSEEVFNNIVNEYSEFLKEINIKPVSFIPVSAREGDNIVMNSQNTSWFNGKSVLNQLDGFKKLPHLANQVFRMPVQNIYKFTKSDDDRRIVAGTIETGTINVGDEVIFLPSNKKSVIKSVEGFNVVQKKAAYAGEATGFTLTTQIYIRPGELMVKSTENLPKVSNQFQANIFWVGKAPMVKNKAYKLKLGAMRTTVKLVKVINVLDASDLSSVSNKEQVDRHDVAECIFETVRPIAFDLASSIEATGRFVIVDNYEIAGGGIVLDSYTVEESVLKTHIKERENFWEKGFITENDRQHFYKHKSKFIVFTGDVGVGKRKIAKELERKLFNDQHIVKYLGISNIDHGLSSDIEGKEIATEERIRRLGELARLMTDSGLIFITTIDNADDFDLQNLKYLNEPNEIIVINVGDNYFSKFKVNLQLNENLEVNDALSKILELLKDQNILLDYYI